MYTLVTVVFEKEYDLLLVQARSLRIFCPADIFKEIIILDNSKRYPLSQNKKNQLIFEYGHLAHKVRFIRHSDVAEVDNRTVKGWVTQQILKLKIALLVETEKYLVLDAKTHLVNMLSLSFLESSCGRANISLRGYVDHPLRPSLESVLTYFNLDSKYIENFTETVTPYVFYKDVVCNLISYIENVEKKSLEKIFSERDFTEFFLYYAYIIAVEKSPDKLYECHQLFCPMVWKKTCDVVGCKAAITDATTKQLPFFSLHRSAVEYMDADSRLLIAKFWKALGLFSSEKNADRFLINYKLKLKSYRKINYLEKLPKRIVRKIKKIIVLMFGFKK